jgi:CheY-like chemotaxis protein
MRDGLPFLILVVDDDEDDRLIINEAFVEIGYGAEVKKFTNGNALLDYLKQIEPALYPSLILLDNSLPGLDAKGLLGILKSNPAYKAIPVVVHTTLLTPSKKEELLAAGAQSCIEKGSTIQDVVQMAEELKNQAEQA